jgi:hypothetical protein
VASRLIISQSSIDSLMAGPGGAVAADLLKRGRRVQNDARRRCPVDHGRLRSDIQVVLEMHGSLPSVKVGNSVDYAWFVHEGTGVYGPRRRTIRAKKRGGVLRFTVNGKVLYRPRVRGVKGRPYLKDALPAFR